MPRVSVHGVDVFFRDEGEGEPIVFGHCSAGSSGQWRDLIKQLSDGHRSLAPDHLGYSRTGAYPGPVPLMDHEIAVIEALMNLTQESVHFVGHSFGASVLVRAVVRMPERVKSLTLIEPILFYLLEVCGHLDEHKEIRAVADRMSRYFDGGDADEAARGFIDYWSGPRAYDKLADDLRASVIKGMAKVRNEWASAFEPCGATIDSLANLKCPILLIAGTKTTAPAAAVMNILREIWPTAKYAEIAGAGHMSPISHASLVNPMIEEFLS